MEVRGGGAEEGTADGLYRVHESVGNGGWRVRSVALAKAGS